MIFTNLEIKTHCDHLSIQPDKSEIVQFGVTPSISVLKNINKVRIYYLRAPRLKTWESESNLCSSPAVSIKQYVLMLKSVII